MIESAMLAVRPKADVRLPNTAEYALFRNRVVRVSEVQALIYRVQRTAALDQRWDNGRLVLAKGPAPVAHSA